LYKNFQKLLKRDGVTAYQVSKATNITNSTFTEWKKGTYNPKLDKLQKIADYFSVTLDYLISEKEADNESQES
jgi:transcriptional regulator with XRE-family HTH domain